MSRSLITQLFAAAMIAVPTALEAQDARVVNFRREMSTDRPDVTESPKTVERGHMQVEMDLLGFTDDRSGGIRAREWSAGNINMKFGLADRVDLQVVAPLFVRAQAIASTGSVIRDHQGHGDVTVRAKFNIWGNDAGSTALAVMPFVNLPSATRGFGAGSAEFGLIVPFGFDLPYGFGAGLMSEVDVLKRPDAKGHFVELVHSATIGHDLFGPFGAYAEVVGVVAPWESAGWRATGNGGVTVAFTPDVQLDFGGNFGLTQGTDRVTAFIGLSFRR